MPSRRFGCLHFFVRRQTPLFLLTFKRDPYQDSNKHGPFLQEVARVLYENKHFAISSAPPFEVFNSVAVMKFEKDLGEYNVE